MSHKLSEMFGDMHMNCIQRNLRNIYNKNKQVDMNDDIMNSLHAAW